MIRFQRERTVMALSHAPVTIPRISNQANVAMGGTTHRLLKLAVVRGPQASATACARWNLLAEKDEAEFLFVA